MPMSIRIDYFQIYYPMKARLQKVFKKYKGICQLCHRECTVENSNADHILPKSKNGKDNIENLQLAHIVCNCIKGDITEILPTDFYTTSELYKLIKHV